MVADTGVPFTVREKALSMLAAFISSRKVAVILVLTRAMSLLWGGDTEITVGGGIVPRTKLSKQPGSSRQIMAGMIEAKNSVRRVRYDLKALGKIHSSIDVD